MRRHGPRLRQRALGAAASGLGALAVACAGSPAVVPAAAGEEVLAAVRVSGRSPFRG